MLASLALAAAARATAARPAAPRPVVPEDTYRIQVVRGIEVSPDAKTLAITVERADETENSFRHNVLLMGAEGGSVRALCRPETECTDPKFSPDGTRIAWLSDEKGEETQIFVARLPGKHARAITTGREAPTDFDWSPDGTRIVYTRLDGYVKLPPPGAAMPSTASARRGAQKSARVEEDDVSPFVIKRTQIQRDGEGFLDERRSHLWIVGVDGGKEHPITSGPYDDDEPRWSPRGDQIAFVTNRNPDPDATDDSDIWAVPPGGGPARRLAGSPGPDAGICWSHRGDRIAFVGTARRDDYYQTTHAMVAPVAGGPAVDLTGSLDTWVSLDDLVGGAADPSRIEWSADDATVDVVLDRKGANYVARIPSSGGAAREILGGREVVGLVRVASASGRIYFTRSTPTLISELWSAALDGSGRRKLYAPNDALQAQLSLVVPKQITAKNSAGDDVESWLYPPVGLDPAKSYPMILYIHGGPTEYDGELFDTGLENQIFPGKGWAVLRVNYRGSTSYGEAFCEAPKGDWHTREYEDLMASVDEALKRFPWIDKSRLGLGGWSYGGIMTLWTVAHTDRVKVGVPERFEIDYFSSFGEDQWALQYLTELGSPYEKPDLYRRLSPATYVPKIRTPLFLIADEKDGNCPPTQAMQLYQRLRLLGQKTELVIYPSEPHTMTIPSHYVDRLYRLVDWFGRYLR